MNVNTQRAPANPVYVYIPREYAIAGGGTVFKTLDGTHYRRGVDGAIRRAQVKVNGRAAKRARRVARGLG